MMPQLVTSQPRDYLTRIISPSYISKYLASELLSVHLCADRGHTGFPS